MELDPKIVSTNHCGTLRNSNESKAPLLPKPSIYDAILTKPSQSLAGTASSVLHSIDPEKKSMESTTNPFSTYDRNISDYRYGVNEHGGKKQHNYHTLGSSNHHILQNNRLDGRHTSGNHLKYNSDDYALPLINNTDLLNLSNSSIANQLLSSSSIVGIGSTRIQSTASHIDTNINIGTSKEISRSHIITDTIPGPESCV